MLTKIKQGSDKWFSLKSHTIGSSEIYALIFHYITPEELQRVGINSEEFTEKPYTTAWHLYHKFVNPHCYVDFELDYAYEVFGKKIEEYALHYLKTHNQDIANYSKGGVYTNGITVASLDIEGVATNGAIITDSNGYQISTADNPNFAVEVKAQSKFQSQKNNIQTNGVDWKFIFQLQYQLMVSRFQWGKILVFNLNNDNQFERGRIAEMPKQKLIKHLDNNSTVYEFTYKVRPEYQYLIEKALSRFEMDIKLHNEPQLPDWEVISKSTQKKQCHEIIYNLTEQQSKLLNNESNAIETDAFDRYFTIKNIEERFEKITSKLHWKIRNTMLTHGKTKIISPKGTITMQSNAIIGRVNKNNI